MTLNIDFTPQESAWLAAQAEQQGLPPAEVIKRLIDAQLSASPDYACVSQTAYTLSLAWSGKRHSSNQ